MNIIACDIGDQEYFLLYWSVYPVSKKAKVQIGSCAWRPESSYSSHLLISYQNALLAV